MKHLLIAGTAILALSACGASEPEATVDAETAIEVEAAIEAIPEIKTDIPPAAEVGAAFLEKNAKLDGVITAPSGLQYKVVQPGLENGATAAPGQQIAAHYHGFFIGGEVFDSSYQRGRALTGPSNAFIPGWNEALGEMKVCEARILYINSDLAYGPVDGRGIPGGSTLLFNMQLLAVNGSGDEIYECPAEKVLAGPEAY